MCVCVIVYCLCIYRGLQIANRSFLCFLASSSVGSLSGLGEAYCVTLEVVDAAIHLISLYLASRRDRCAPVVFTQKYITNNEDPQIWNIETEEGADACTLDLEDIILCGQRVIFTREFEADIRH